MMSSFPISPRRMCRVSFLRGRVEGDVMAAVSLALYGMKHTADDGTDDSGRRGWTRVPYKRRGQ